MRCVNWAVMLSVATSKLLHFAVHTGTVSVSFEDDSVSADEADRNVLITSSRLFEVFFAVLAVTVLDALSSK